jgi:hypothetical protein
VKHKIASPGNSSDFVFQPPTGKEKLGKENTPTGPAETVSARPSKSPSIWERIFGD